MKQINDLNELKELSKEETPLLVYFYADWCGPCKMMTPILSTLKENMGDRINIVSVDTEKQVDATITYQVRGIPNLLLFKEGFTVWQNAGVIQAKPLQENIEERLRLFEA